jgi:D-amino peptidase
MKLFISSDIEGTCGICDWDETRNTMPEYYRPFAEQMTREVAAACRAAEDSGLVEDIFIKDAHGKARNLILKDLPRSVRLLRGWDYRPCKMMAGAEEADAVAMTGYHSPAFSMGNPLAHTNNLRNQWIKINGEYVSEFMENTFAAAYYGKPVIFVSGDAYLCEHARSIVPNITAVPVLEGRGSGTLSIHPDLAVERIYDGMKKALEGDINQCRIQLPEYFEAEIQFKEAVDAAKGSYYPGAERVDAKTVRFETDDYYEVMRFMFFVRD